jgi:hypothetical protein
VLRSATSLVFIFLAQVLCSLNELCAWSLQGVHNKYITYFHRESIQPSMCPYYLYKRSVYLIEPSPSLFPNCLCDQVYNNSRNEICDEFYDHPPCPSASFHQKICSHPIKGMCPNQPSTAPSTRTFIIILMQSLCDEAIHSTEQFTKFGNVLTELYLQQTVFKVFSDTIYCRSSGEYLTNPP